MVRAAPLYVRVCFVFGCGLGFVDLFRSPRNVLGRKIYLPEGTDASMHLQAADAGRSY